MFVWVRPVSDEDIQALEKRLLQCMDMILFKKKRCEFSWLIYKIFKFDWLNYKILNFNWQVY